MRTQRNARQPGFTLLELMVVLVVLAVMATLVTLSVSAASGHTLESTAEHLASTLEQARWQAITTGGRIGWEAPRTHSPPGNTPQEALWYEQTRDGIWRLRTTPATAALFAGVSVSIALPRPGNDAPARLVLGPEPVGVAACVLLTQEGSTLAVASDGVAPFSVRRDGRC